MNEPTSLLVSGGTSDIGLAVARHFRDAGARVVITGDSVSMLESARASLVDGIQTKLADVTEPEQVSALGAGFTRLDALVNWAGTIIRGDGDYNDAAFERVLPIEMRT